MATTTAKIDDYTLEVTDVEVPTPKVVRHELKFLKSQLAAVIAQKEAFVAARNAEIDYLRVLIQAAKDLKIIEREDSINQKQ